MIRRRLAVFEGRIRTRLDRAANRMEDHDPMEVEMLLAAVRVLNRVDRAIRFRPRSRG